MNPPSRRALGIGIAATAALIGFIWIVTTQGPMAAVKVTVAEAKNGSLALSLFGIGTVEARRSYSIGPTSAGRIGRVLVDQGDSVKAGQLLAEMDPVDLEDRLAAGQATADRAANNVRASEASLAEASSRSKLASTSAERYADLRRRNFVSQEAADAKRHEANAAQAARTAAEATLAAARDEARRTQAERAGTGKARAHLRLISPVDGVVAARLGEPGSSLVAGQTLLQVVDPSSLWIRARIDQGRSSGLASGMEAQVALRSQPGKTFPGTVKRVELLGDAVTEERIAHIELSQAPSGLTMGELAEVTLALPLIENALLIPATAVKRMGQTDGVWKINASRASFSALTTGPASLDGQVQVLSGLNAGESVIVHSSRPLAYDMKLKVVDSLVKGSP
jgi:HlyD family secretion protein